MHWRLTHFPDRNAEMLMIGKNRQGLAVITDYPDSVEVRVFQDGADDFITVRDRGHDQHFEEIEGLKEGAVLVLDGARFKLGKADGSWQLISEE